MNTKRILALVLALVLALSMAACAKQESAPAATEAAKDDMKNQFSAALQEDGQIELGLEGVEVEVNVTDVHMDSFEASTSGNWEAMFTPVDVEGRAIDLLNFDLTPTAE